MWTAVVIGGLVASSRAASPPIDHRPEHRFTLVESGGGLGFEVENTTVFSSIDQDGQKTWIVERNTNESKWCDQTSNGHCVETKTSSMDWIDGRSCAALPKVMLQLAKVRTEENGSAHPWASDTPLLSLIIVDRGLMATERLSEYAGPLVDWWRSAQERLKPCWTKGRPPDL